MRVDEFQDFLYTDLAWRKKEISQLFMVLQTTDTKEVVGKSMILLLYAHWEGFIKKSSKCYLKFVSDKNIKVKELTHNFEALMLKKFARECIEKDSKNLVKEFALMDKQRKAESRPFNIKIDIDDEFDAEFIDTQYNLSSKVLANIIQIIGRFLWQKYLPTKNLSYSEKKFTTKVESHFQIQTVLFWTAV